MAKKNTIQGALAKLQTIRKELNQAYYERNSEITSLLVALLAREHILLLGPPGTAKSAMAKSVCESINGAQYFRWLLTKFSTPEEIFGPVSLKGLENDEFRRLTRKKLPESNIAFLDEVFKANSAILNSLLTIINEREYHNNGAPMQCPLHTVVGASNEMPEADDLGALYDRFLLRHWVAYLEDFDNKGAVYFSDSEPSISSSLTEKELESLQNQVGSIKIPAEIQQSFLQIQSELAQVGIVASDRRWKKAVRIVRAFALLQGHSEVEEDDLLILEHVMWREKEQRTMVREKVGAVASPLTAEALSILDAAKESHRELLKIEGSADFLVQAVEVRATFKEMRQRLTDSITKTGGKSRRAEKVLDQLKALQVDVKRRSDRALD